MVLTITRSVYLDHLTPWLAGSPATDCAGVFDIGKGTTMITRPPLAVSKLLGTTIFEGVVPLIADIPLRETAWRIVRKMNASLDKYILRAEGPHGAYEIEMFTPKG